MKYFVWFLIAVLIVLHQDYWQWNNATLVFGFVPFSLLYHAGISVAAATVWVLAVKYCWPPGLDDITPVSADRRAEP